MSKYESEIRGGTQDLEAARDDAGRALGFSRRARAYSEKARYSRGFKLIPIEEYNRLFDLAMADHDRAVALAPGVAEIYLDRGMTFYSRAALEGSADPKSKAMFDAAKADFTRAVERDSRNEQAIDMRGLVCLASGDLDQAFSDFTEEMKLNPRAGRLRLAEAYCQQGSVHQGEKKIDSAISDYEKVIELGAPGDSCDCQPDSPLAWLYLEKNQYDKSWEVVHRAQKARRWIQPELVERLKKASGRDS